VYGTFVTLRRFGPAARRSRQRARSRLLSSPSLWSSKPAPGRGGAAACAGRQACSQRSGLRYRGTS